MRNMLAFLAVVAVTVAGVGWYLGWFQVHSVPSAQGQRTFSVEVNTNKISHDLHNAEVKVEKRFAEKTKSQQPPPSPPAPDNSRPRRVRPSPDRAPVSTARPHVDEPQVELPEIEQRDR